MFPQVKKVLKGKCFANVEEEKQKMAEALIDIKINKFKNRFGLRRTHLDRCIASHGEYFKDD